LTEAAALLLEVLKLLDVAVTFSLGLLPPTQPPPEEAEESPPPPQPSLSRLLAADTHVLFM
jgi:hypothetical protein